MVSYLLKNIAPYFFVFIISNSAFAQQTFQGKAYYSSKTTLNPTNFARPNMSEEQKKRMAARLKSMSEKKYELTFNKTASIYKVQEQLEIPTQGQRQRGGRFRAAISGAIDGNLYKNVKNNQLLISQELLGKSFLIKGELPKLEWKMSGETKQIGQYTCFKATAIKTGEDLDISSLRRPSNEGKNKKSEEKKETPKTEVTAWYTLQIPINQGPGEFWGLPGLILEINTPKTTLLCTKVILNPSEKETIKAPTKGKEITKEAYISIAAKKFKEMRENFRQGRGNQAGGRPRR